MIALFLAFLFCLGAGEGIVLEDDSSESCSDVLPNHKLEEMEQLNFIPDEKLLKDICPNFIKFMECEEPGVSGEHQEYFFDLKHLILDICEEDSRLQKAYLASVNCFRNGLEMWLSCKEIAENIYLDYRKFITRDDNKEDDTENEEDEDYDSITSSEPYCMMETYALACMSVEMLEKCGAEAHETLLEMLSRSHVAKSFCTPEDTFRLNSDFLEFLAQEEHSNLDIFQLYFELKRK